MRGVDIPPVPGMITGPVPSVSRTGAASKCAPLVPTQSLYPNLAEWPNTENTATNITIAYILLFIFPASLVRQS